MRPSLFSWLIAIVLGGCSLEPWTLDHELRLRSAGGEPLDRLPLVPRLLLEGPLPLDAEDVWLVRGRISNKDLGQILASAPGEDLRARRVPLSVWTVERGLQLAPLVVLESSTEYSLLALSVGELGRLMTSPVPTPIWWRWGTSNLAPGGWVIHCVDPPPWTLTTSGQLPVEADPTVPLERVQLEPDALTVDLFAGFSDVSSAPSATSAEGSSACIRFRAPGDAPLVLPPHRFAGRYFEPTPIEIDDDAGPFEAPEPRVRVSGSAAFLELPAGAAELSIRGSASSPTRLRILAQSPVPGSLPLGQFEPGEYALTLAHLGPGGLERAHWLTFVIEELRGYPVLTEALANPLGPEPEAEWVEIVNIGRAPLDLLGYQLEDSSGGTVLPSVVLEPGGVGLVVREDFVVGGGGDVVPAASALPIVVAEIGDGGLSNGGEAIRLRDPGGQVLSEIPAQSGAAGQSVARLHPLAPDWATSFRGHAAPGASPGSENELETP